MLESLTENLRWALGLVVVVIIPAIWKFTKKVLRTFQKVEELENDKEELRKCVVERLDKLSGEMEEVKERLDRNSDEHGRVLQKLTAMETDISWLKKKNGS